MALPLTISAARRTLPPDHKGAPHGPSIRARPLLFQVAPTPPLATHDAGAERRSALTWAAE